MRRLSYIWLILLFALPTWAQTMDADVVDINLLHLLRSQQSTAAPLDTISSGDTIAISVEKQDTILVVPVVLDSLSDTVPNTEDILLQLVARQSQLLHAKDTIWEKYPHPLCMPLMYVPTMYAPLTDTTRYNEYSIPAIRAKARRYITTHHVDMYVAVSDTNRLKQTMLEHLEVQRAIVKDLQEDRLDIERALRYNDSPWKYELNLSLQITQNYATENWHQGAANAFSMLWNAKAFANYKGEKLSWDNKVEWRLGLSTVSGDTLRKINTTDDIFQIYSKLGYQLHPKWYVSLFTDFKTNFFPNFQKNANKVNTTFLTPIRYNVGLGIDYKPLEGLAR